MCRTLKKSILILMFCFLLLRRTFAASGYETQQNSYFKTVTGEVIPLNVKVKEVKLPVLNSVSNNSIDDSAFVEYEVYLPSKVIMEGYSGSLSDDTTNRYVKAWARLNYKHRNGKYLLTSVEGNWRIIDRLNNISIKNTELLIACNSYPPDNQRSRFGVSVPFNVNTGFSEYADSNSPFVAIGANTFVDVYSNEYIFKGNLMLHIPIAIKSAIDPSSFARAY